LLQFFADNFDNLIYQCHQTVLQSIAKVDTGRILSDTNFFVSRTVTSHPTGERDG